MGNLAVVESEFIVEKEKGAPAKIEEANYRTVSAECGTVLSILPVWGTDLPVPYAPPFINTHRL